VTKASAVTKLGVLNQLKNSAFALKYPGVLNVVNRLLASYEALPEFCFVAGTLVHTDQGLKVIEKVSTGDRVLARDEFTGEQTFKPVLATVITHPARLYHLQYRTRQPHRVVGNPDTTASNSDDAEDDEARLTSLSSLVSKAVLPSFGTGKLTSSGPHPFYVKSLRRFVPAEELKPGSDFLLADGREAALESIETEDPPAGELFTTYNFEVADYHTYFVGTEGVWVHNKGKDPCGYIGALTRTLIRKGMPRRTAILEAMKNVKVNSLVEKISFRLRSASDFMLDRLPSSGAPSAQTWSEIFTVNDWKTLIAHKQIRYEYDGFTYVVKPGAGDLRGHHIVTRRIQQELQDRFGVNITDIDDSPVKVFTNTEHYGAGANSLHNRMNAWEPPPGSNVGRLHPDNLSDPDLYASASDLVSELLRFYKSDPNPDWVRMVKATRGWAAKNGIPVSE
jgi:hypothetical protein